ncbi:MAG: Wzz/FepE/Etk N-terminal domain-containing protein [Nibricoccus sp.]
MPTSTSPEPRLVNRTPSSIRPGAAPQSGLSLSIGDIYYTLFRHKWKIILCSLLGFGLAAAMYTMSPPPFQSEAKLFIRYVVSEDGKTTGPGRDDTVIKSPDQRGETIITSELEILNSMDLAEEVVRAVGADKIISGPVNGDPVAVAAFVVNNGLTTEVPPKSSVIRLVYRHTNPTVTQNVLREIIGSYLKKHVSIHQAVGIVGDFLSQETDQLRARLNQTEEELRQAMKKAGVISLEESKKTLADQAARLRQQINDLKADLAQRTSILKELTKDSTTPASEWKPQTVPADQVEAHQKTLALLASLRQREEALRANYTEQSSMVQEVRAQQAELEERRKKLEADYPALLRTSSGTASPATVSANTYDPNAEAAQIVALQSRINELNNQLEAVRTEAAKVDQFETSILELRRRRDREEANYRYYSDSLEQARIKETLGSGRVSNISMIEAPTRPFKDWKKKSKILAGLAGGGIAIGLGWAFLIELFIDRSIRRSSDIERTLKLPLFLSIPRMKAKGVSLVGGATTKLLLPPSGKAGSSETPPATLAVRANGDEPALSPFYETLRDRLINYFDTLDVRHKPKLVAVTGLGKNSGITTIAAGLARSFSETGEGNVLLVDMTKGQGSAQHFHKGSARVGLEQMLETKDSALVNTNLYVVSEDSNSERLAKGMPQRFNQLIPKLKASDFDYIIFDMPPVNQISITPRLANFMDMMLMVVEAEKADRDATAKACNMLTESKSPVGIVLNKTKTYVPKILNNDALGEG